MKSKNEVLGHIQTTQATFFRLSLWTKLSWLCTAAAIWTASALMKLPASLNMTTCHFFFWGKWRRLTHICDTLSCSSVNGAARRESGESEGKVGMDNNTATVWQKTIVHRCTIFSYCSFLAHQADSDPWKCPECWWCTTDQGTCSLFFFCRISI